MDLTNVLITGSSGFLARHLIAALPQEWTWRAYDLVHGQDICNHKELREAAEGCRIIFNLAGLTGVAESNREPAKVWRTNAFGAATVFRVASDIGATVIHASSHLAPFLGSHYAASKRAAELAAATEVAVRGTHIVVLRIFNAYGPGQPNHYIIPKFLSLAAAGHPLPLFNGGTARKDYIYAGDVAQAFLAGCRLSPGTVADVGTGVLTSARDVGRLIYQVLGLNRELESIEVGVPERKREQDLCADISVLAGVGWRAEIGPKQGIRMMI